MMHYYDNKIDIIRDIFSTDNVILESNGIRIGGVYYPIIEDVIILSEAGEYTDYVKNKLNSVGNSYEKKGDIAEDIQYSFGEEWKSYNEIMPEHEGEFKQYFDLVDIDSLKDKRVCDLGCGNGRWSYFLKDTSKEIILIDFSDAIFTARKNLYGSGNCLFFMCDLKKIPFREDFTDFILCLGVLHHLPTPCLEEVIKLKKYSNELLIFLYYALDNRPFYYKVILKAITIIRMQLSKIRGKLLRELISGAGACFVYLPMICIGHLMEVVRLGSYVPLYDFYRNKTVKRIRQDVYDRFFTSIEQRVAREEILNLKEVYSEIKISENIPYWHFLCKR